MAKTASKSGAAGDGKREEFKAFLFLTAVLVPVLAVLIVGGYGLLVWLYQLFTGPPTG